jgi:peptidoglycan L-alanyl-D-glutamate endopeptidase CwlK
MRYSNTSQYNLSTCDSKLRLVFREVLRQGYDHSIICGERSKELQDKAYEGGFSQVKWPDSKHNLTEKEKEANIKSQAVDVMPYFKEEPHIRWDDEVATARFAGYVLGVASSMGIYLEWGGDWKFKDMPHYQLK